MGIVYANGFESGISPFKSDDKSGAGTNTLTVVRKTGSLAYSVGSSLSAQAFIRLVANDEYYFGAWVYPRITDSVAQTIRFNNTTGPGIRRNGNSWQAVSTGTTVVGSAPDGLHVRETWEHIQIWCKLAGASSRIVVKIAGVIRIDWTGTLSSTNLTDIVFSSGGGGSPALVFDDVVIRDDTWPGDVRIIGLPVNGDTAQKDWTPDTGSVNFSRVNNNSDASYVSADTNGHKDLYDVSDWSNSGLTAMAITHWLRARKETADEQGVKMVLKSGATEVATDKIDLITNYDGLEYAVYDQDPNTFAAWTPAAIDALQIGQEYVD